MKVSYKATDVHHGFSVIAPETGHPLRVGSERCWVDLKWRGMQTDDGSGSFRLITASSELLGDL